MHLFGKIKVTSVLPERLGRLHDLAYNMWWSWHPEVTGLLQDIDPILWKKAKGNPVRFLQAVNRRHLDEKSSDNKFLNHYDAIVKSFDDYMSTADTWFLRKYSDKSSHIIAYFSAEYGLSEVLPIYSGGLGVLSGDHCKTASDMGIPLIAIGLLYKQGYFVQEINSEGWQQPVFNRLNPDELPIRPVLDNRGEPVNISIELPGRVVYAMLWKAAIGRVSMYLIDTDIEHNSPEDRELTAKLYGGDQETRIQQEIFLGIGGIRVLDALGINATVFHMNEGHSAFMGLELIRKLVQEKHLSFEVARQVVAASTTFTTHTPVPAGNDVFPFQMIDRYLSNYWEALGINRHEFLDLGLKIGDHQNFNMTVLALNIAGSRNGVSELHGAVSRNIFKNMWPGLPENEVPISHITNGIHTFTWLSPLLGNLYNKYLEKNTDEILLNGESWANIDKIPDEELWNVHCILKSKMIENVREKLKEQRLRNGEPPERMRGADVVLDPRALTIGFARRFATYKRANLIFRNMAKIQKILNNNEMPVQIIFAGKAHPADRPAHEIIKNINDIAAQEGFNGKVVLVENYNMSLARCLVQGVDVWMNNPRRPLEASGTSGQKVCVNGVINFSVLDGWWCEGYNRRNGWSIGDDTFYQNEYYQDNADSESIYSILEQNIIPLFYDRDAHGVPIGWVSMMKESIKTLSYEYSTYRMLREYTENMYVPGMKRYEKMTQQDYAPAKSLAVWTERVKRNWQQVQLDPGRETNHAREREIESGQSVTLSIPVRLGDIKPQDVRVEVYYGPVNGDNLDNSYTKDMNPEEDLGGGLYNYSTQISFTDGGEYGYTFRVLPYNPNMLEIFDTGLIKWAVQ